MRLRHDLWTCSLVDTPSGVYPDGIVVFAIIEGDDAFFLASCELFGFEVQVAETYAGVHQLHATVPFDARVSRWIGGPRRAPRAHDDSRWVVARIACDDDDALRAALAAEAVAANAPPPDEIYVL
jgi:hypothetical protein